MKAVVDEGICIGCGQCVDECPVSAINLENEKAVINDACIGCAACVETCPVGAISME